MAKSKKLPIQENIREQVNQIVADFNRRVIKNPECFYVPRFNRNYLYLDRRNHGLIGPIARLKYQTDMNDWEFAIYKYSREQYDPDEWFFPGVEHVNGTVEGALEAGLKAYPLREDSIEVPGLFGALLAFFNDGKKGP